MAGAAPPPVPVQYWQELPHSFAFNDPKISTILEKIPGHVILMQHTAEIVHAAVVLQAKLQFENLDDIVRNAFSKWAWNIDAEGEQ
jgi:hypothetical protein